jgi:hypothetical protein
MDRSRIAAKASAAPIPLEGLILSLSTKNDMTMVTAE